jgi:hypothetical protein
METRKCLNGKYEFINEYKNTRNGFAHKTVLLRNGYEVADNTNHYLNRTWECYRYQSVMQGCISGLINEKLNRYIELAKQRYNIKRLSKMKKEELLVSFEELSEIKELRTVYKELELSRI